MRDGEEVSVPVAVGLSSNGDTQVSGPGVSQGMPIAVLAAPPAAASTGTPSGGGFGGGGSFGGGGGDGGGRSGAGQGG